MIILEKNVKIWIFSKKTDMKYTDNNGNEFENDVLLPCPFCGSDADLIFIGNNATKKRSVEIKCANKSCRAKIVNAGIRFDHSMIADVSIKAWNCRHEQERLGESAVMEIWVESNVQRPPKDGAYFTQDSTGLKSVTEFHNRHWQILPGKNPVKKWLMPNNFSA